MQEKEFQEITSEARTQEALTEVGRIKKQRKRLLDKGHEPSEATMLRESGMYDEEN